MKIRTGFVSNSSSSSFVLAINKLTAKQLMKINNHIEVGKKLGIEYCEDRDAWIINEAEEGTLTLNTRMDNFDMHKFLHKIGAFDAIIKSDHS
jgi:hypothetical protein